MNLASLKSVEVWGRGLLAATISGGASGVGTGFAAIGIDPTHFNLSAGIHQTLAIAGTAALINAILGCALYLQKSPLPQEREVWSAEQREAMRANKQP